MAEDAMKLSGELRYEITEPPRPLHAEKGILFDSYARRIMSERARLL
jgi:hypothetical protein